MRAKANEGADMPTHDSGQSRPQKQHDEAIATKIEDELAELKKRMGK